MPDDLVPDQRAYLLPAGEAYTDDVVCVRVYVPNKIEYLRALLGSLDYLGTWLAWQRDDLKRGRDAARAWKEANELTASTVDAGCPEDLSEIIIIDDGGNISINCEGNEDMGCVTINIYCDDVDVNGGGGSNGNGNGGGVIIDPPTGFTFVKANSVLVDGLTDPANLTIDEETIAQSFWIYGEDYDNQADMDLEFLFATNPGAFAGVIFAVGVMEFPDPQGIPILEIGGVATGNINSGNGLPQLWVGTNGNSASWDDVVADLVANENYNECPTVDVTSGSLILNADETDNYGTIDVNIVIAGPWLVFSDPFG